jgi:CelD/BcsL family acetyltransferase involved in cellulose biosynthesis
VQAGTDALAAAIVDIAPGAAITRRDRCDYLDLRQLQPADTPLDAILAALSRNTRQQARRALRLAERAGPLTLTRATSPGQAEAFLAELMRLHGEAWQARKGKAGAFATPFMREFIAALVAAGVRAGTVDVVKVADPERTIGVLLNFVHRGGAYAYQSGFAYSADNRDKPGLVCHLLAAADAHSRGLSGYHFMGGESRYKSSLSNAVETLSWIETHRSAVVARTEYAARALWRRFKRT